VTVKIKYSDFTQATRSRSNNRPFANGNDVLDAAAGLLATVYPFRRSIRLLGVTLSSLTNERVAGNGELLQLGLDL
jgi:DNA polymerase IV